MAKHSELIQGTCQQVLFSPKGSVEGVLVKVKGLVCQVTVSPEVGEVLARDTRPGKRLRMLAVLDPRSMTGEGAHPVYEFSSFANAQGEAIDLLGADPSHTTVKGTVAALHDARHV
jgi:hypothetical protein